MALPTNNLFLRLHKWASRQDENFLTESVAVVLVQCHSCFDGCCRTGFLARP